MNNLGLRHLTAFLLLSVNTWKDCRKREISVYGTLGPGLFGLFLTIAAGGTDLVYFAGFSIGLLFLGFSLLTQGAAGAGDAFVLLSLGALLPWDSVLASLTAALLISAFCCLFLITVKHRSRKADIPFLPFLLAGYLLSHFAFFWKA